MILVCLGQKPAERKNMLLFWCCERFCLLCVGICQVPWCCLSLSLSCAADGFCKFTSLLMEMEAEV